MQRQVSRDSLADVQRNREDKAAIEESLSHAKAAQGRMEHRKSQGVALQSVARGEK